MSPHNKPGKAALGLLCLLLGAMLGACSTFSIEGKKIDYKSTGKLPPLEVPPDLTRPTADDRYAVPDINPRSTATFSDYSRERAGQQGTTAGPAAVLPQTADARIERDGAQRWLVVRGTPDQVWPVVKDFWQESGFIVNIEVPEGGVMETDWAENRAKIPDPGWARSILGKLLDMASSTSERDKFRTRLERGTQPGTTEIYISHRGMEEVYVSTQQEKTMWQPRPSDPNLEAEMLGRLMTRFGVETARAKTQVATAGSTAPPRATLDKGADGTRTLALDDQFDRAWRRVGLALDRVGFTVEDRDRSKGLYFVRYIDPQIDNKAPEKSSWFSRLKFWGNDKPKQLEQFRIEVKDSAQGCQVKVFSKDGAQENPETAGKILALLYEQLK
jgi:outer membrane protein assembly factor BamC